MDYAYDTQEISIKILNDPEKLKDKEFIKTLAIELHQDNKFDSHRLRDNQLRFYYKDNVIADIDASTGKGTIEFKRKVPFIGHTMYLHKTTNSFWVWYSDIFGASMLLIAITGVLIPLGKNGFKQRGWKLALLGLIFPLIFLFFLA